MFKKLAIAAALFMASFPALASQPTCFPQKDLFRNMEEVGYTPLLVGVQEHMSGASGQVIYAYNKRRNIVGLIEINRPDGKACVLAFISNPTVVASTVTEMKVISLD